jgi:hypothetical protein
MSINHLDKYDPEKMTDSKKKTLYSNFWPKERFPIELKGDVEIKKTKTVGKDKTTESVNSYSFYDKNGTETKDRARKTLEKVFGINNPKEFGKKYKMAVSGDGNEDRRITTLHSSSLSALLFFYNVTGDNSLTIQLKTDKHERTVVFTKSYFEYQSKVLNNPSNMDVVLVGKDKNSSETIVFFLESKFSEYYLSTGRKLNVPSKYLGDCPSADIYNKLFKAEGFKKGKSAKDGYFVLESDVSCYLGGIKQMISHYCGTLNDLQGDIITNQREFRDDVSVELRKPETKLILGEIIFDGKIKEFKIRPETNPYDGYKEKYKQVAKIISEDSRERNLDGRFEILKEALDYSTIAKSSHIIESNIREFYGF